MSCQRLLGLALWLAAALPVMAACPARAPVDNGPTANPPRTGLPDPQQWMAEAAAEECSAKGPIDLTIVTGRAGTHWLVANPCRSGAQNVVHEVFSRAPGSAVFCAIDSLSASSLQVLPARRNGYARLRTTWHLSAFEGGETWFEIRPHAVVPIREIRRRAECGDDTHTAGAPC